MPIRKQADQPRKMSDIMLEMAERLIRNPAGAPSSEAVHVALFFANVAWNECVGLDGAREGYRRVWESIESDNPELWNELKSNDIDGMIDELIQYKKAHYPDDRRRILVCGGTPEGKIHVEWLAPAAPGVDAKWETQLYGLVRTGDEEQAVGFLKKTRGMSAAEARVEVARIRTKLSML